MVTVSGNILFGAKGNVWVYNLLNFSTLSLSDKSHILDFFSQLAQFRFGF